MAKAKAKDKEKKIDKNRQFFIDKIVEYAQENLCDIYQPLSDLFDYLRENKLTKQEILHVLESCLCLEPTAESVNEYNENCCMDHNEMITVSELEDMINSAACDAEE